MRWFGVAVLLPVIVISSGSVLAQDRELQLVHDDLVRLGVKVQTLVLTSRPHLVSMTAMSVAGGGAPVSTLSSCPGPLDVSNRTGRSRIAARMRQYLAAKGVRPARLSNAGTFSKSRTTIYYRHGWSDHAGALAELLPAGVGLQKDVEQGAAIRVELGADLLDFDLQLIELTRSVSGDDSI